MRSAILITLFSASAMGSLVSPFMRETNSFHSASRGVEAWDSKDYAAAVAAFGQVTEIHPGPLASYDLGTSLVAAGDQARGAAALEESLSDPALRASALYNRGSGALRANDLESAISDLQESLRADPGSVQAKRNLEIALNQKREQERQSSPNPDGEEPEGQQDVPRAGDGDQITDEAQSILRSVEQQEQEELKRMRRARITRRPVGW